MWSRSLPVGSAILSGRDGPSAVRITLSADGSRLATRDLRGGVQLWNMADGTLLGWSPAPAAGFVHAVAFFPDNSRVAVTTADTVTVWDVATNTPVPWGDGGKGTSRDRLLSRRAGRWLATADLDHGVRLPQPGDWAGGSDVLGEHDAGECAGVQPGRHPTGNRGVLTGWCVCGTSNPGRSCSRCRASGKASPRLCGTGRASTSTHSTTRCVSGVASGSEPRADKAPHRRIGASENFEPLLQ